jgi:hypothetical protein
MMIALIPSPSHNVCLKIDKNIDEYVEDESNQTMR